MPGLWQTVCGKVEANESSIEACKRETTEETGLNLPSEKMKFIFNDRRYDCDVYITKIRSNQQPKRTEPDKMSAWKPITAEQYIDLAQLGSITDTHIRRYDQILEQIEQFEGNDQLDNWDEWNSWDNTNDPFTDEEWETKTNEWQASVEKAKDPYEGTNYREEWHIFRGWKYPCKRCGEEDHHSHIICIKCNKVAFGCFARCECNEFKEISEEQELETEPEEDDDNDDNDPKGMNLAIEPTNEVKDSTFITAEVYGKRINVLLDSGSHSSVITKMFLDEMRVNIDKPTTIKMIDINGEKKAPLGKINRVPVKINDEQWEIEMIVTESKNYNVILGSDWLSLAKGIMNYQEGMFYYEGTGDKGLTLMTCWQRFPNPHEHYFAAIDACGNDIDLALCGR